jgi:hypothetical protein
MALPSGRNTWYRAFRQEPAEPRWWSVATYRYGNETVERRSPVHDSTYVHVAHDQTLNGQPVEGQTEWNVDNKGERVVEKLGRDALGNVCPGVAPGSPKGRGPWPAFVGHVFDPDYVQPPEREVRLADYLLDGTESADDDEDAPDSNPPAHPDVRSRWVTPARSASRRRATLSRAPTGGREFVLWAHNNATKSRCPGSGAPPVEGSTAYQPRGRRITQGGDASD